MSTLRFALLLVALLGHAASVERHQHRHGRRHAHGSKRHHLPLEQHFTAEEEEVLVKQKVLAEEALMQQRKQQERAKKEQVSQHLLDLMHSAAKRASPVTDFASKTVSSAVRLLEGESAKQAEMRAAHQDMKAMMWESAKIAKFQHQHGTHAHRSATAGKKAGGKAVALVLANGEVTVNSTAAAESQTAPLFAQSARPTKKAACAHCLNTAACAEQASTCYFIECGDAVDEWCYMCTDPKERALEKDHEGGMCTTD